MSPLAQISVLNSPPATAQVSPTRKKIRRQSYCEAEAQLDALARAQLCLAFFKLSGDHNFTLIGAARILRVSPSTVSGKDSLPARYARGGVAALRLAHRPPRFSRIAAATEPLLHGYDLVWEGHVLPQSVGGKR